MMSLLIAMDSVASAERSRLIALAEQGESVLKTETRAEDEPQCRICYSKYNPEDGRDDLIAPCKCSGSVKYVHSTCLKRWRFKGNFLSEIKICQTCKSSYTICGEISPYRFTVFVTTLMLFVFIFSVTVVSLCPLSLALTAVILDATNILGEYAFLSSEYSYVYKDMDYYIFCMCFMIFLYKLNETRGCLSTLGYLVLSVSIFPTDSVIIRTLVIIQTVFHVHEMFLSLHMKVDRMCFYLLNLEDGNK